MKLQGYRQAAGGGEHRTPPPTEKPDRDTNHNETDTTIEERGTTQDRQTDYRDTRQTPSGAKAGRDKKERERNRVGETDTDRGDD